MLYQINQRKKELLQLCINWGNDLQSCPPDHSLPAWGPSYSELEAMEVEMGGETMDTVEDDEDDRSDGNFTELEEEEVINDTGLMEHLDALDVYNMASRKTFEEEGYMDSEGEWEDIE